MAHPGGRPLKFQDPQEFDEKVDRYFDECKTEGVIPTITGMAVYLDTSRETLREYKERAEFVDSIKKALDRCQSTLEGMALANKANPTMAIFSLKNNYGWVDKTETDVTTNGNDIAAPVDANMLTQFLMNVQDNTKR
jgi:hypothetical protein